MSLLLSSEPLRHHPPDFNILTADEINRTVARKSVDVQHRQLLPLSLGLLLSPIFFSIAALSSHNSSLIVLAATLFGVGAARFLLTLVYQRYADLRTDAQIRGWRYATTIAIVSYSTLLGIFASYAIAFVDDVRIHLLVIGVTIAYSAGSVGRNAGLKTSVAAQIATSLVPLALALAYRGVYPYGALAILCVIYIASLAQLSFSVTKTIISATENGAANSALLTKLQTALGSMSNAMAMLDADGRFIAVNPMFATLLGETTPSDLDNIKALDAARRAQARGAIWAEAANTLNSTFAAAFAERSHKDIDLSLGDGRTYRFTIHPTEGHAFVILAYDVTEERRAAEQARHQATHDSLTGLPNRPYFEARLSTALAEADACSPPFWVLSLDLDRFKTINDTLGHPFGDQLLTAVADRIRSVIGPDDLAARFGGDEFMILHFPTDFASHAVLANALIEAIRARYDLEGQQASIGVSIGLCNNLLDAQSVSDLLRNSDLALYAAKAAGKGAWRPYQSAMRIKTNERRELETELKGALTRHELSLHYQPIVSLGARRIEGCEALLRWRHPTRGFIPPDQFIGIAEDNHQIIAIGRWVLAQACRNAMTWPNQTRVSVNVSVVQIVNDDIVAVVKEALAETGLPAHRLDIEITESTLICDNAATASVIDDLHALGVTVSLDDFGTGYASFSSLARFRFNKIKLDRSLVNSIDENPANAAMITAIAKYAACMAITIVAEGVEEAHQIEPLIQSGVTLAQGFYFSRPKPLAEIPWLLPRPVREAA